MKYLVAVLVLAYLSLAQEDCSLVLCPERFCTDSFGCGNDWDGCCPTCCDSGCADCFAEPCAGWSCSGYPGYECRSNYCGGCNRDWFSSKGFKVECPEEVFVIIILLSILITFQIKFF